MNSRREEQVESFGTIGENVITHLVEGIMKGFLSVFLVELGFAEVRSWKDILERKKKTLKPSVGGREAEAYLGKSDRFGAQEISVEKIIEW